MSKITDRAPRKKWVFHSDATYPIFKTLLFKELLISRISIEDFMTIYRNYDNYGK
ncbi:hypothetical protein BDD26_3374 [Xenorhabdus cabanillasii]|uniref:Uncharacterized protein n=1 Tax=Xenorhabdus cabanillasii TaxID=351673 RepID=A0A3D9UP89_9GAMM|nr:hypothetical protein BDD26_3374 [Xenorhabdus cabanillasii]